MPNYSVLENNSAASPVEQQQQQQAKPFQFVERATQPQKEEAQPTQRNSVRKPPVYVAQLNNQASPAQDLNNVKSEEKRVHFDETADIPTAQNQKKRVKKSKNIKNRSQSPGNTQTVNQAASKPVSVETVFPAPVNQAASKPVSVETVFPAPVQSSVQQPAQAVPKPVAQTVVQAPVRKVVQAPVQTVVQPTVQPVQQVQQQAAPVQKVTTPKQAKRSHQLSNPLEFSYHHVSSSTFNNGKTETNEKYEIRQPELVVKAERNPHTQGLYNVVVERTSAAKPHQKEVVYQQLPAKQFQKQLNHTWQNALTSSSSQPKALQQSESPARVVPQLTNEVQSQAVCPHHPAQLTANPHIQVVKKAAAPSKKVSVPVIFFNNGVQILNPFKQARQQQARPLLFRVL